MGNSCGNQNSVNASAPTASYQNHGQANLPQASAIPLENGAKFDTIVIGGGMAGVAAAVQLSKAGQNVALFQANGFIGGRLKTLNVPLQKGGAVQFDEGASWIHGSCDQNPITKLSKKIQGVVMKQTDDDSAEVYDENGQSADKQAQQAGQIFEKLMQKCEKHTSTQKMSNAFTEQQNAQILNNKYFMYNVANDIQFQTSGSIFNLAANGADDDEYDGKEMLILSGYQRFVEALSTFAKFSVYVGQKIVKVNYQEQANQVVCANGIAVYSKNVVIAVPIGVLKAQGIKFSPPLPEWKADAIRNIGFGNVCKILLDFANGQFISGQSHYIGVVAQDVRKRGLATYFLNLKAIAGIPALMTFGLGDNADQAQKMPQQQLKSLIAKRLSAFADEQISPNSFNMYRTSWRGNQNFQGTYAYAATTTVPEHWQNMAKPVFENGWYFCGEHTTSKYRGTVHGAYLSGVHAAKWVKNQTDEQHWVYPDFAEGDDKSKSSQD